MINNGDEVKDTVSGFQGIVTGITRWATGCDSTIVQPPIGEDGKLPDAHSFDIPRLKVIKAKEVVKIGPGLAG